MAITLFPFADYWWLYAAFTGGVLVLLAVDLGVLVLVFVGVKMAWLNDLWAGKFPITWSLGIIGTLIGASVVLSLVVAAQRPAPKPSRAAGALDQLAEQGPARSTQHTRAPLPADTAIRRSIARHLERAARVALEVVDNARARTARAPERALAIEEPEREHERRSRPREAGQPHRHHRVAQVALDLLEGVRSADRKVHGHDAV